MNTLVRKALLLGVGVASLTQKQVEAAMRRLAKEGNLSKAEGEAMVRRLIQEGRRQQRQMDIVIERELRTAHAMVKTLDRRLQETLKRRGGKAKQGKQRRTGKRR